MISYIIKTDSGVKSGSRAGFTLIEIMIVLSIFSIITGALFVVLSTGRNAWQQGDTQIWGQSNIRQALHRMVKELRQTTAANVSGVPEDGNNHSSITFYLPNGTSGGSIVWGGPIQYFLDTADANGDGQTNQLIRVRGGNTKVLANNVNALNFRRMAAEPNLLWMQVTTQGQTPRGRVVSGASETQVLFRN